MQILTISNVCPHYFIDLWGELQRPQFGQPLKIGDGVLRSMQWRWGRGVGELFKNGNKLLQKYIFS